MLDRVSARLLAGADRKPPMRTYNDHSDEDDRAADVGPVEAHPRGASAQLRRAGQCGQAERAARECARIGLGSTFLGLDLLPQVMPAVGRATSAG